MGDHLGPAVNAVVGFSLPLGPRVSLRPGIRAGRLWQTSESCPNRCAFDSYLVEAAIRYRGPSGFLFELGLPLAGWLPVGPDAGETQPHLTFYTLATPDIMLFSSLLFGYAFDL